MVPGRHYLRMLFVALLALCAIVGAWLIYHETRVPQNQAEVLNRMVELTKEHRFDKAVQVVQAWMNKGQRDTSKDGFLYDQIAWVYIAKARDKSSTRADSIRAADMNLEKALSLLDQRTDLPADFDAVGVTSLFEIGGSYEALGDTADEDKCQFYARAEHAFLRQLPMIKGDSYTASGTTIPLEPLRATTRRHLDAVAKKSSQAGCQAQSRTTE